MDVVRDLGERVSRFHVQRFIASLKWPSGLTSKPVESRHPRSLQPFHAHAQIRFRSLKREVEMIAHDHERVNAPAKLHSRLHQTPFKGCRSSAGVEQVAAIVASIDDVVVCAAEFQPQFSGHFPAKTGATLPHNLSARVFAVDAASTRNRFSQWFTHDPVQPSGVHSGRTRPRYRLVSASRKCDARQWRPAMRNSGKLHLT
jgi:hypothetical protein